MHPPALDAALWAWVVAHRVSALNSVFLALTALGGNGIIWFERLRPLTLG